MDKNYGVVLSIDEYREQVIKATAYDIFQALANACTKESFLSIKEITKIIAEVVYA